MFDYLTVYGSGRVLTLEEIVYALFLSFVLSAVFAAVYRFTFQGLSYSRAFVQTMILGAMVVARSNDFAVGNVYSFVDNSLDKGYNDDLVGAMLIA